MFKCDECGRTTRPREPRTMVVAEKRDKTYVDRAGNISEGWEIVSEKALCPRCARKLGAVKA